MDRTLLVSLALLGTATTVRADPCTSGFDVAPPAVVTGSGRSTRATLVADHGVCAFDVRLCMNAGAPDCAATPIQSLAGRGRAAALEEPETSGQCGTSTIVTLRAGRRRVVRRRLKASMRTADGVARRLRLTLACMPEQSTTTNPPPPTTPVGCTPDGLRECEGITGRTIGRLVDFAPSLPIESCGDGTSSNYLTPAAQLDPNAAAELHVIGVYEAAGAGSAVVATTGLRPPPPPAHVDVTVHATPKPVVLVLLAYESVRWNLTVEPGAVLERVITSGYDAQDVAGAPSGTPVEALRVENGFGYFYGWELSSNEGGGEFLSGIQRIRAYTGLIETSFEGCYSGAHFGVPHSTAPPPLCPCDAVTDDETRPLRDVAFPGCEEVTGESQYCLTGAGGSLALLGIDSGTVCALASAPAVWLSPLSITLAWRGEAAYSCIYGGGLVRVSLRDGSVQYAQMPCGGVAIDDAGRLLISLSAADDPYGFEQQLYAFDSWADALAGRGTALPGRFSLLERFTVRNGTLYTAWHSTDTIDRFDLASGAVLEPLHLDRYDGWILGMSVTGDGRLLIPGDTWGDTVWVFDATTGVAEGIVEPATSVSGLACVDRR